MSPTFTVLVAIFVTSLITANITAVKLVVVAGLVEARRPCPRSARRFADCRLRRR